MATQDVVTRALLLVNLYEFHEINDSLGRHFGDELLRHIANRLSNCVRREDLLARVSDDEFAILLADGIRPDRRTRPSGSIARSARANHSRWIRSPCKSMPASLLRCVPTIVTTHKSY